MREYPVRAIALVTRKIRLLISAHDAYDVPSMVLKDRALHGLWISWALLIPLAAAGIVRGSAPVVIYAMCAAVSPIAFFVTARHRNPLLIALAILGGAGLSTLIKRRALLPAILIILAAIALSIPGDLQREDDYLWTATFAVSDAMTHNAHALAATWLPENVPPTAPDVLHQVALEQLSKTTSPPRSFSIAIALLDANDPTTANLVLQRLQSLHYRPFRRTRAVSSVAYYRAKALIKLHNPFEAQAQLARARDEAPGDADILALSAFLDRNPQHAYQLDRLHDPFTRDWALARAAFSIGDEMTAQRLASRARAGIPDWPLPADLR